MSYFKKSKADEFECADKSIYHSALEEFPNDADTNEYDDEEDYYTYLHASRMNTSSDYYTSL